MRCNQTPCIKGMLMEHFVVSYTLQHNVYLSLLCSTHNNTNSLSIVIAKNKTTTKIVTLHSRGYPPVPPPRINTSQRLRNEVKKSNITFHLIYQIVNRLSLFGTKTTSDRTYWASTYCTFMICGWDEILGGTEVAGWANLKERLRWFTWWNVRFFHSVPPKFHLSHKPWMYRWSGVNWCSICPILGCFGPQSLWSYIRFSHSGC